MFILGLLDKVKDSLGSKKDKNESKDFKYLDNLIHNGKKEIILDSDIILHNNEKSKYSEGIKLNIDGLVINGAGYTIDAKGKTRVFNIKGINITLKNIIFKNGFSGHDDGGAINNNGDINIDNCKFINNASKKTIRGESIRGGAIYNKGSINFNNCQFRKNKSSDGGAIYNNGSINFNNCQFNENNSISGGAIYNKAEIKANGCSFIKNNAKTILSGSGGAIYNKEKLIIQNSFFCENFAKEEGSAIFNRGGSVNIAESKFHNNGGKKAGTIIENWEIGKNEKSDFKITNSIFSQNNSLLISNFGTFTIKNSVFLGNTRGNINNHNQAVFNIYASKFCKNLGAVLYNSGFVKIIESIVYNNKAKEANLITNSNSLKINNCEISNNLAKKIIVNNQYLEVNDCIFDDNAVDDIICNKRQKSRLSIDGGKFTNNNASNSIIYNNGNHCHLSKTHFETNNKNKEIINENNLTLNDSKFKDTGKIILNNGSILIKSSKNSITSKIEGEGTVNTFSIPNESKFDFSFLDKKIHENKTKEIILNEDIYFEDYEIDFYEGGIELDIDGLIIDGNGKTIDGGKKSPIFLVTGKNIIIKNITLKNGYYHKNYDYQTFNQGGIVKVSYNADLTLMNVKFINNNSEMCGGAIFNNGEVNLVNCSFCDNSARNGGAITNNNKLDIFECRFSKNTAEKYGGAITVNGEVIINKSNFNNNSAGNYNSGASLFVGNNIDVFDSIFKNHHGEANFAVVIDALWNSNELRDLFSAEGHANFSGCTFLNNKGTKFLGGAILRYSEQETFDGRIKLNTSLNVENCIFKDNEKYDIDESEHVLL